MTVCLKTCPVCFSWTDDLEQHLRKTHHYHELAIKELLSEASVEEPK